MQNLVRAVSALHGDPSDMYHRRCKPNVPLSTADICSSAADVLGVAALGGGAWLTGVIGGKSVNAASVAVMPFDNLSGDPKQAYFSDGLAAEVRSELTRNALLQVAAQTSSNSFRDHEGDVKTIMQKLAGRLFARRRRSPRSGDNVRYRSRLIRPQRVRELVAAISTGKWPIFSRYRGKLPVRSQRNCLRRLTAEHPAGSPILPSIRRHDKRCRL